MKHSVFFNSFQITMPKCHKNYPKFIWQVSTEWHTLGFHSAVLSEVYWNYATHIVRVCVTPILPQTSKLDLNDKCNLQVHFVSKRWLVCTTFSAINPLHLRIHSSKSYFLISLHVFTLISSITLPTDTPQMMS